MAFMCSLEQHIRWIVPVSKTSLWTVFFRRRGQHNAGITTGSRPTHGLKPIASTQIFLGQPILSNKGQSYYRFSRIRNPKLIHDRLRDLNVDMRQALIPIGSLDSTSDNAIQWDGAYRVLRLLESNRDDSEFRCG
jgi:hypothetical protein